MGPSCIAIAVAGDEARGLDRAGQGGFGDSVAKVALCDADAELAKEVVGGIDDRHQNTIHGKLGTSLDGAGRCDAVKSIVSGSTVP